MMFLSGANIEHIFKMAGLDKVSRIRMPEEKAEHIRKLIVQIDEVNRSRQEDFMLKISVHFTRVFKRVVGISPSKFRTKSKECS